MSAPGLDTAAHVAAIAALLSIPERPLYERGDVPGLDGNPGPEPLRYLILDLERTDAPSSRMSATASRSGWRASVICVGKQRTEVRAGLTHVSTALDSTALTIAAELSTPIHYESTTDPRPDGAYMSAESVWTYVL